MESSAGFNVMPRPGPACRAFFRVFPRCGRHFLSLFGAYFHFSAKPLCFAENQFILFHSGRCPEPQRLFEKAAKTVAAA
ncbi:hypothetical protein [Bifidobacterium ruminantium]|uniref:hypothetical protein n=1 Tax=Bifidobacterium ruminantium TaxID=78346 RepID=UPI002490B165|nr:hypothetical protein [Bifidobacterium ruminantium]